MANLSIITLPDIVLRAPTRKVGVFDDALRKLIGDMRESMHTAEGVGLAATQIGESLKLAVIEFDPQRFKEMPDDEDHETHIPFFAIANPTITHYGPKIETLDEGCLSVPGLTAPVPRSTEVNVLAQNENGERIRIRARGFLARILQHEIDHLNGLLIVDRTSDKRIKKRYTSSLQMTNDQFPMSKN